MIYQFLYYQNRIAKAIAARTLLQTKIKPRLKRGLNGGVCSFASTMLIFFIKQAEINSFFFPKRQ